MTRDEARAAWAAAGLTYSDLNLRTLQDLRKMIDLEMKSSGLIKGSYHMHRSVWSGLNSTGFWAALKCASFYFKDREAVTFNADRFVGFAGWADENNVQPILHAFSAWVQKVVNEKAQPAKVAA
jgi:hypothetical protein